MQEGAGEHAAGQNRGAAAAQCFTAYACERLDALCDAVRFNRGERARACSELSDLLQPWGSELIGTRPRQPSDLSDDHFPIEFSISFTRGEPEVRVLFEPQSWSTGSCARWLAAQELNARLAKHARLGLSRLAAIEDLFEPAPLARWSAWHSLRFSRQRAPRYKIYLNPEAQGASRAPGCVAETLRRLGFADYARRFTDTLLPNEQLKFFSLDLDDDPRARVKLYAVQHGATRSSIARTLAVAPSFAPGVFDDFWQQIACSDGPFSSLPISTYLSLVTGDQRPSSSAVHFPTRAYAASDRVIYERVCGLLHGADVATYQRAIAAFAERPLEAGSGIHAYVSLAQEQGQSRISVYLACEAYAATRVTAGIHRIDSHHNSAEEQP